MMKIWRKLEVDKILIKAYKQGIIMSGLSAGAICWFNFGNSDSRKFNDPNANLMKVKGLGIIKALFCPHYDIEKGRKEELKKMMKKTSGIAIAIENSCAIEIIDDKYRIISSRKRKNAYKVYWNGSRYNEKIIKKEKNFMSLKKLLEK